MPMLPLILVVQQHVLNLKYDWKHYDKVNEGAQTSKTWMSTTPTLLLHALSW